MRTFTFKGLFLTAVFMLLGCSSLYAADDDLITKQITIKLDKAGTLPDKIGSSRMYKITNLKLVGEINGTDWKMIRKMAGYSYRGNLSVLDLSEAKIVKGGDYYYNYDMNDFYYTSNDVIGWYAFKDCTGLTSVTLPAGITSIGWYAFEGCSGLTSLNLPSNIKWIGKRAFYGCSGLTSLNLPASITEIDDEAFSNCSGLKEVNFCINDDLETYLTKGHPYIDVNCDIKYYLNDKEITSIVIPSNVTSLGHYVFQNCRELTSVTIPAGITEIGPYAFYGCRGLTSLNLPASITEISNNAFDGCSGLTSLNLPDGITSIASGAFYGCSRLTSLTLPAGITSISNNAFDGCSGLTSLTLPAGITEIGPYAFYGCSGLTSLTIPSSVNSLGDYAFQKCTNLQSVYVSWQTPISAGSAFYDIDKKNCTLYVPQGTEQDYFLADVWGDFGNIVEFDATGIDKTTTSTDVEEVSRYSVNGQRLVGPTKGLNIVKYSDGSVKKVAVE